MANSKAAVLVGTPDVTGSISQVKSEDIQNRTITSPESALQGKTAGVQVTALDLLAHLRYPQLLALALILYIMLGTKKPAKS